MKEGRKVVKETEKGNTGKEGGIDKLESRSEQRKETEGWLRKQGAR